MPFLAACGLVPLPVPNHADAALALVAATRPQGIILSGGNDLADAETFRRDPQGRLQEIGARAASLSETEGQYMGRLRFTPAGWAQVEALLETFPPARRDRLDMTGLLRLLLAQGATIDAIPAPWPWGEVDSETDLALYKNDPQAFGLA